MKRNREKERDGGRRKGRRNGGKKERRKVGRKVRRKVGRKVEESRGSREGRECGRIEINGKENRGEVRIERGIKLD